MRGVGGFDIIHFIMKRLLLAVGLAANLAANADGEKMTWGLMMQLGHNMWGEAPLSTEGMTDVGSLTDDPLFVRPSQGDYRLKSGSRCIDAGLNLAWMAGATDLDGNARIYARRHIVDIGCYEFSRPMGMTLFLQ